MVQTLSAFLLGAISTAASACSAAPAAVERSDAAGQPAIPRMERPMVANDAPVSQRFATLEAYLDWLRLTQGPVDGSWYEEIRPGVYELRTGNLRVLTPEGEVKPANQTFTRDELARQFGFSK